MNDSTTGSINAIDFRATGTSNSTNVNSIYTYNGNDMLPQGTILPTIGTIAGSSSNGVLFTQSLNTQIPNMQTKVAIFKVARDEDGKITSSEFLKELWVEKLPNVSLDLLVVKELEPGFDPKTIVIKDIMTVSLY